MRVVRATSIQNSKFKILNFTKHYHLVARLRLTLYNYPSVTLTRASNGALEKYCVANFLGRRRNK